MYFLSLLFVVAHHHCGGGYGESQLVLGGSVGDRRLFGIIVVV